MGHLQHFNTLAVGHHKTVCQWARLYGGVFRVRLANVNVGPRPQQGLDDALYAWPVLSSHLYLLCEGTQCATLPTW